ncbi:hypothetical protein ACWGHM_07740 [Streptomyces sp. NPDC054904]|uniref:hypothetical protein n=1 Tax=unclassified Streptomyces TaxID=2593676 RepID=UPI002481CAB0|nr:MULTISPECIES: hypothetical protein [unclassified Streptomyces]MDA5282603.1 hypothetical protein [Streptomyces sp. Isolate_45]MDX2391695.1 hypothetical protein [Streptomyces sp. DK15]
MTTTPEADATSEQPHIEVRWGGLRITVQRIPGWLVGLITTAAGAAGAWWSQQP